MLSWSRLCDIGKVMLPQMVTPFNPLSLLLNLKNWLFLLVLPFLILQHDLWYLWMANRFSIRSDWQFSHISITDFWSFFKGAQAGGRTRDLLVFVYFLSLKQRLRPLGYCAPFRFLILIPKQAFTCFWALEIRIVIHKHCLSFNLQSIDDFSLLQGIITLIHYFMRHCVRTSIKDNIIAPDPSWHGFDSRCQCIYNSVLQIL